MVRQFWEQVLKVGGTCLKWRGGWAPGGKIQASFSSHFINDTLMSHLRYNYHCLALAGSACTWDQLRNIDDVTKCPATDLAGATSILIQESWPEEVVLCKTRELNLLEVAVL